MFAVLPRPKLSSAEKTEIIEKVRKYFSKPEIETEIAETGANVCVQCRNRPVVNPGEKCFGCNSAADKTGIWEAIRKLAKRFLER